MEHSDPQSPHWTWGSKHNEQLLLQVPSQNKELGECLRHPYPNTLAILPLSNGLAALKERGGAQRQRHTEMGSLTCTLCNPSMVPKARGTHVKSGSHTPPQPGLHYSPMSYTCWVQTPDQHSSVLCFTSPSSGMTQLPICLLPEHIPKQAEAGEPSAEFYGHSGDSGVRQSALNHTSLQPL